MCDQNKPRDDHIKVVVRSRPLNEEEKAARTPSLVSCDAETKSVKVATNIGGKRGAKSYNFDMVFGQYATQEEIYEAAIEPIVEEVLLGYNCTVFAYGQTGTGKTHTMEGVIDDPELQGVIPRAVDSIFTTLSTRDDAEYSAKCSFLELYNEELQDLLSVTDEKKLRIIDDKSKMNAGVACHNLEEVNVTSTEDLLTIMHKAMAKRQVAATNLNKTSSRSHCIFTFTVHIKETTAEGEDLLKVGKLNLVDLAGSESIGRSGAKDKRAREAGNINKSLLTLGRVITALVERTPHVPYRDSKLTRLLQESLGGRAKTCIIATVAPSVQCMDETISTLDYASRAKSIKNKPEANQRMTKRALIKEYVVDIERLRQELQYARAKDGVFLPEDQYNDMVASSESQKRQLEELEAVLETRAKELAEITDMFENTKETLQKTEKDLTSTKTKLDSTKLELGSTKLELLCEKEKVKESNVVIQEHQKTESKLVNGTKTLQSTIDSVSSDVQQLHNKLDRKTAVEDHNIQVGKEFSDKTVNALTKMGSLASEFSGNQIEKLQGLSSKIETMTENGNQSLSTILDLVKKMQMESTENYKTFSKETVNHTTKMKEESVQKTISFITSKESVLSKSVSAMESNIHESVINIIGGYLEQHQETQEKHAKALQDQIAEQRKSLEDFVIKQKESMQEIETLLESSNSKHQKIIEEHNTKINDFMMSESKRNEEAMQTFTNQFQDLLSTFSSSQQDSLKSFVENSKQTNNDLSASLSESREKSTQLLQTNSETCESWQNVESSNYSQIETMHSNESSELTSICANIKTATTEVDTKMNENTTELRKEIEEMKTEIVSSMESMGKVLDNHSTEMESKNASAIESVNSQMENINESVNELKNNSSNICAENIKICNDSKIDTESFEKELNTRIEEIAHSCDDLISNALKTDQPTGTTPMRKEYPYSPTIPITSPADRIIERYRDSKGPPKPKDAIEKTPLRARAASTPYDKDKLPKNALAEQDENAPPLAPTDFSESLKRLSQDGTPLKERNQTEKHEENTSFLDKVLDKSENEKSTDADAVLSKDSIMKLKVTELRKELGVRNCPQFGNKAILQTRLLEWMESNHSNSDTTTIE